MRKANRITETVTASRDIGAGDIQTHCGFKEPMRVFGSFAAVNRHCDEFMLKRDMIWVAGVSDYLPSEQAFYATSALAQNR
jgi:hypothetical protein